jgi:broad specificity phosphatase PhoE
MRAFVREIPMANLACAIMFVVTFGRFGFTADTVLFVVRHAERSPGDGDVPLSDAGSQRAKQLSQTLEHLKVDVIYHTATLRSKQTAAPLSAKLNITPIQYTAVDSPAINGIMDALMGKRVLIVGHSDTVHLIVGGLIGKTVAPIGNRYANLFVVEISDSEKAMVRLQYRELN